MLGVPSRSAKVRDLPSKIRNQQRLGTLAPSKTTRRFRTAMGFALASIGLLSACASRKLPPGERPVPSLSSTQKAKDEFRALSQPWLSGRRKQRQSLEEGLVAFRERHAQDDLARVAAVYLAWNAIERDELPKARELVRHVLTGPSGATRDWAEIAEAAILRREGEPAKALERLAPLVGKVIDPHARALFSEELVRSAILATRYYEAVGYMDVWLQQAGGEDRTAARRQIERALEMIPPEVARSIVRAPAESGYSQELRRALASRLEARADDAVVDYSLRDPAHVDGPTVGLLLSLGSAAQRARAAEALSGVLDGLGLPPRAGDAGKNLVTSDDAGDPTKTEAALGHLASRGAAIAIAGLDPAQAAAALRFSERTSMPIILLSRPEADATRPASAFLVAGGEEGDVAAQDLMASAGDVTSPLRAFVDRHGAPPTYLAALARDAAVLAQAALAALPTTKATEPGDVAWRYVETTKALERARGHLWTTESRGFGPDGDLPREARITEIE